MGAKRTPLSEAAHALEQKCAAFADAVKVSAKESTKIGSGMKAKYNDLISNVNAFTKTLSKCNEGKDLLNFPVKLACCTLLDGVIFANSKTKPLVAQNTAVQQLFGIIEFLYVRSSINSTFDDVVQIPLESNELYIYVDTLFKIFETIAKVEKLEEVVHLRTVQTVLQLFSSTSPILVYEDIIRRSFLFLDDMLKSRSNEVKPIVEGGLRQLMQCIVTNSRGKPGTASQSTANSGSKTGVSHSTSAVDDGREPIHIKLVVELLCCFCSVTRNENADFMRNLEAKSAGEILLLAIATLPKGIPFEVSKLYDIVKGDLYLTVKYALTSDVTLVQEGCMMLARILDHGYYHSNRSPDFDRGVVKFYEALFNFVELDVIDNLTSEGKLRKLAWMRAMTFLLQSNEVLNDLCNHATTRKFVMDILQFTVKQTKISKGTDLDSFFEGAYKSGHGQRLISEQIDLVDQETLRICPGYMKIIPLFSVQLEPDSCAMDFCNLTNGVVNKFSRFNASDSMDIEQLTTMESALSVDTILVASHILYSLVVGEHRHMARFAPYRIFYPKISDDSPVTSIGVKTHNRSDNDNGKFDDKDIFLQELGDILIQQLEKMMNTLSSQVMQVALLSVLQGLLVVCDVLDWKPHYMRCLEMMTAHLLLAEREFSKDHKTCSVETWLLYLLHINALNALLLNYPSALNEVAWDSLLEHLLSFLYISRQLGVANTEHFPTLQPREVDDGTMATLKELYEKWQTVIGETLGAFDKIRVHDFEILGIFVTYIGFNIAIPLLSHSQYAMELATVAGGSPSPDGRNEKLIIIKRILGAWPNEFVNMIENDDLKWPQLMRDLAGSINHDSILATADSEFLHCLFGIITELSFAREHDSLMLLTGIVTLLVRDCDALELMIETVCSNIVSLFLTGHEEGKRAIDAGVCVLYKTMCDNAALSTHVINGLKTICTTVPQILAASKGIINCLAFATKDAINANDVSIIVALIDVFVAIVEDSVDSLQDESRLPFVECLFMLATGAYSSDNNAAFRVIGVVLDFAEKMAAQSHLFGDERPSRVGEEQMWTCIFRGLHGLGLSEFAEIRQCSIKSLAMFIKGRINRFGMTLWRRCCTEMLVPLAEGLLNSLQTTETSQTIFTACDELCVALREADDRYRSDCEMIMTTLISGLEKVVNTTLKNKTILPNELNSALSLAVGIATNIIIDYSHSDYVWGKCIAILQLMSNKELDLLRQNFFKSICAILSALGGRDNFPKEKVAQVIRLAIGEPSSREKNDFEALCKVANTGETIPTDSVIPPWLFVDCVFPPHAGDDSWLDLPCPSFQFPQHHDTTEQANNDTMAEDMSRLCDTLRITDEGRIKITLRDKIQNSMGILQEMQMLQLITLHYSPQILAGIDAVDNVTSAEIPKTLDPSKLVAPCHSDSVEECKMRSTLQSVLHNGDREIVIENMSAHLKIPPLMALVEAYSPISKLFRCLGSIKSPEIYDMLVRALVSKYLVVEISNMRLSLQLMDNIVLSVRDTLLHFLTGALPAITGDEEQQSRFVNSREYRMLMHVVLPLVPMLVEVARRMVEKRAVQPVAIILYQECINLVKYVYFGLYVQVHFLKLEPVQSEPVVDYWRAVMKALDFFVQLNFPDDISTRLKYIRMLHAITLEMISSLVVNPFSVAPPFMYGSIVKALDRFASGESAVLRRIALQRLSDASCYPFIPLPPNTILKNTAVIVDRVRMTKRFLFTLAKQLCQFLSRKDNEIEVLAAIQVLESITTLPNELVFDQEYLRKHKYMRFVHRRPLVSIAMPYLLDLLESDNKRVVRATRRIMSMFLEEMGVQVVLP